MLASSWKCCSPNKWTVNNYNQVLTAFFYSFSLRSLYSFKLVELFFLCLYFCLCRTMCCLQQNAETLYWCSHARLSWFNCSFVSFAEVGFVTAFSLSMKMPSTSWEHCEIICESPMEKLVSYFHSQFPSMRSIKTSENELTEQSNACFDPKQIED